MAEENENNETPQSGSEQINDNAQFDAGAVVSGTVPEVKEQLEGLSSEQLQAVKDAESDGQDRAGVHAAVDAALSKADEEQEEKAAVSTDEKVDLIIGVLRANGLSLPAELED